MPTSEEAWWVVEPIIEDIEPKVAQSVTDLGPVRGHELLECLSGPELMTVSDKVMHERVSMPDPLAIPINGFDVLKHLDLPRDRFDDNDSYLWYKNARELGGKVSSFAFDMVKITAHGRTDITKFGDENHRFTLGYIHVKNLPRL